MRTTISQNEFINDMTREGYGFTYDGAKLLFDYLEQYEEECETDIEYDPIAFRCEYSEYCTWDYINDYYDIAEDFIGWLLDREYITEEESELLKESNYKLLDGNNYDYYTLEEFFDERLQNDEKIVISKDSETFIINTNY